MSHMTTLPMTDEKMSDKTLLAKAKKLKNGFTLKQKYQMLKLKRGANAIAKPGHHMRTLLKKGKGRKDAMELKFVQCRNPKRKSSKKDAHLTSHLKGGPDEGVLSTFDN